MKFACTCSSSNKPRLKFTASSNPRTEEIVVLEFLDDLLEQRPQDLPPEGISLRTAYLDVEV